MVSKAIDDENGAGFSNLNGYVFQKNGSKYATSKTKKT